MLFLKCLLNTICFFSEKMLLSTYLFHRDACSKLELTFMRINVKEHNHYNISQCHTISKNYSGEFNGLFSMHI